MKKRTGAASFYIVAISTLLFTIIAMSFAAIVISELARTTNSDLSQSAYDSALAGIEDAKVAILNYQNCLNQGYSAASSISPSANVTCDEIIYYMEHPDCDTVGHILNRIPKGVGSEVLVQEVSISAGENANNMEQAYTCVKISSDNPDYRGTIAEGEVTRVVPIKVASPDDVQSIRVKWYSSANKQKANAALRFSQFVLANNKVGFPTLSQSTEAVPPTMSVQLIQTASTFELSQLDVSNPNAGTSDGGLLFMIPINRKASGHAAYDTYYDISSDNALRSSDTMNFVKANSKTASNLPLGVYCGEPGTSGFDPEFSCSVSLEVPDPIAGPDGSTTRNGNTFMLVLSVPYGQPETDFAVEVCTGTVCQTSDRLSFLNQINIDSTGRANDLYRRIEARVETISDHNLAPDYAVQLLDQETSLLKTRTASSENGSY